MDQITDIFLIPPKMENHEAIKNSWGLFHGIAGNALMCFVWGRVKGNKDIEAKGLELLNDISEHIGGTENISFEDGILGIGWTVEWLAQNNLIKVNTDVILEEVDDTIYKLVVYTLDKNISLTTGVLGKIAYFLKRIKSTNPETHRYRHLCHQECIVILTDNLDNLLREDQGLLSHNDVYSNIMDSPQQLIDMAYVLQYMSEVIGVNDPTIKNILIDSGTYIESSLNKLMNDEKIFLTLESSTFYNLSYAVLSYFLAGKKSKNIFWEKRGREYLCFLNSRNYSFSSADTTELFKALKVNTLLNYYFPGSGYNQIAGKIMGKINREDVPFEFNYGVYGLSLCQLCIDNPEFIKDWGELLFIK